MPHPFSEITRKLAFTLAEVLITLGIIGIIAALTLPALIQKQQERETIVRLKKFYSVISEAVKMAELQNGSIESWGWSSNSLDTTGAQNFINILSPSLKIIKNCGIKKNEGCFPKNTAYKYLNGKDYYTYDNTDTLAKAKLNDGTMIAVENYSACKSVIGTSRELKSVCGTIVIDINGEKAPNQLGKDTFWFWITKYGVIPFGVPESTDYNFNSCNSDNKGYSCAAWVIFNENLDYLKCPEKLGWDKNLKCD